MTSIYKEDIEACQRRVEAWWNHEIIDRVVVQVRAPLDKDCTSRKKTFRR
jgi:hypothetical protein